MSADYDAVDQARTFVELAQGEQFAIVPDWIVVHPNLGAGPVRLYMVYAMHAAGAGSDRPTELLMDRVMIMTGVESSGTIRKWRKALAEVGAVSVKRRRDKSGAEIQPTVIVHRYPPFRRERPPVPLTPDPRSVRATVNKEPITYREGDPAEKAVDNSPPPKISDALKGEIRPDIDRLRGALRTRPQSN